MRTKPSIIDYLRLDINRIIKGNRILFAVAGAVLSLFFSLEGQFDSQLSVYGTFQYASMAMGFVLLFSFCAYPYAGSLVEDFEKKYIYYQVMRGSMVKYIISKVIVIMLSSIMVMALGCCLFALFYSNICPWKEQDWNAENNKTVVFGYLLKLDLDFFWYFLYGLQRGIYSGILSLGAAFLSLYLSNKMFVLIIPVLLNQFLTEIFSLYKGDLLIMRPMVIFNAHFSSSSFLWSIFIGIIAMCILGSLIHRRIKVLL